MFFFFTKLQIVPNLYELKEDLKKHLNSSNQTFDGWHWLPLLKFFYGVIFCCQNVFFCVQQNSMRVNEESIFYFFQDDCELHFTFDYTLYNLSCDK